MGLDMYLHAEHYVSSSKLFEGDDPSKFDALVEMFDEAEQAARACVFPSARVVFTVAYWRKANQIHSWFVRECQGGRDECQITYVSREKLKELREICLRLLADRSNEELVHELLEPQGGFFFGSTAIGDWYWEEIASTVEQLDRAIALPDRWSLYYRSSW